MMEPWWDKITPLFIIAQIIWYIIPIAILIFVISIYKDVKRILQNLPKNEKDKV